MIHFEGDSSFPRPLTEVLWELSDAGFLANCLSDVEVTEAPPARAVWKMRPSFAFIRATLETTLEVLERPADGTGRYRLVSSGIGASSTVEVTLTCAEKDGGTALHWSADITKLTGLLKMAPRGLIQSAANKVIEDTWAA